MYLCIYMCVCPNLRVFEIGSWTDEDGAEQECDTFVLTRS
jgi:hypothetical protein